MKLRELTKESESAGMGFRMRMDETGGKYVLRVSALGLDILVCETRERIEAEQRWANTYNDLADLQRIAEVMVMRGREAAGVVAAFKRATIERRIPHLNYIG